jgi:flagellar biosynthesis protein FlhB
LATVVEQADTVDLKSTDESRAGSTPASRNFYGTIYIYMEVQLISLAMIAKGKRIFKYSGQKELNASVAKEGILNPICVKRISKHHYKIMDGMARVVAAEKNGLLRIPAYIIRTVAI